MLRHHVSIEHNDGPPTDDYGAPAPPNPKVFAERWCQIEPLTGNELIAAQHVVAGVTHRVRMRLLEGLTPAMWIRDGARVLQISRVLNVDERGVEQELFCRETV